MSGERYSLDDAKKDNVCSAAIASWQKDYEDDYYELAQVHKLEAALRATQAVPTVAGEAALVGFNVAS